MSSDGGLWTLTLGVEDKSFKSFCKLLVPSSQGVSNPPEILDNKFSETIALFYQNISFCLFLELVIILENKLLETKSILNHFSDIL